MIKKWIQNLRIRYKILLITIVALISILLFGFVANYLFQTGSVVSFILKAERLHNVEFHSSSQEFYRYLNNRKPEILKESLRLLDQSNVRAGAFKELQEVYKTASDREIHELVVAAFNGAVESDKDYDFLTERLRLMLKLGTEDLIKGMGVAAAGLEKATEVRSLMLDYIENPSEQKLEEYNQAVIAITHMEEEFAGVINKINQFVNQILIWVIVLLIIILSLIVYLLTFYISSIITKPMQELTESIDAIAKGSVNKEIHLHAKDELGHLADSFRGMQHNLKEVINHTKDIAAGNFQTVLQPKSKEDDLSIALNKMSESLKVASENDKKLDWLKSGLNSLNEKMRGSQDVELLTSDIISFITKYLDGLVGVLYLFDEEQNLLRLTSSYAFTNRKEMAGHFALGEGLVGQVAKEKQMITLSKLPEDYSRIRSATGNLPPRFLLIAPILFENKLIGVVEMGSLEEFSEQKLEFLREALNTIGIAINVSLASTRMAVLLHKTQEQAQELQAQQEELRQSNEELEEQTKALKESEGSLQTQQEELRVTNEELQERTRELEKQRNDIKRKNDALEQATEDIGQKAKELELASKYKSEFLANMSHELRTPLNSILVLSQLLAGNKDNNLTNKQVEYASTIKSSGTDLLNLINEILDLSKVEAGKLDLSLEKISFGEIMSNLEQVFLPIAEDKNLKFKTHIGEGLPDYIVTDSGRLQQILRNFCSNALKFTSDGEVKIDVFKPSSDQKFKSIKLAAEQCVGFSVKDTGIGIPKDKLRVVFEAFQQVDGTTSRRFGGTGLGLTISRSFAELLKGEIQLKSVEGEGSEFILFVPLKLEGNLLQIENEPERQTPKLSKPKEKASEQVQRAANEVEPLAENPRSSKNANLILIIEDDADFSSVLDGLARDKGFDTLVSADGEKGLHYADYYQPDAILLDVGLPGIDGWEVMDRLKENPQTRHIPVHFISGADKPMDALKMGAIGFLSKPVNLETLNEVFNRIEKMVAHPVKKLLIVEDDEIMRNSIVELIGGQDVQSVPVASGKEACEMLAKESFDCVILDLGLRDMSGFDLLEKIRKNKDAQRLPVIIYTGKDLSRQEEERLQKYADSIIIKGVKSPERLLSETTLFLHRVEAQLPEEKQKILHRVHHDKEEILKDKLVLVVDDDMRNVFALSSVLEEKGMNIIVGRNGREGIEKLQAQPEIDLVLMDIMMPEMDGYEAMQRIRKMDAFKKIPIIALTAKAMKDDRNKCIAAGANDYLSKPVDSDKLVSLLRVWLYK